MYPCMSVHRCIYVYIEKLEDPLGAILRRATHLLSDMIPHRHRIH